jgi:hypothetical protein
MVVATSTGATVASLIVGLLLLIGIIVFARWLFRRVVRVITWPFRAMRQPAPTGLGGEYEQLVRSSPTIALPQERRTRKEVPMPTQRLPFPPSTVMATPPTPAAPPPPVEPSPPLGIERVKPWRRSHGMPAWVSIPLVWLGMVFVIFTPLGVDWFLYGLALFMAVLLGLWAKRRYRVTVLSRAERSVVMWIRWGKRGAEPETPPNIASPT